MSYKFAHIGSYNRNLGDNIALLNVRNEFNKYVNNIELISLDINDIFWAQNNNPQFTINFINKHNLDGLVIGGGGLIEYKGYQHHHTHYKLPFNKEILTSLNCPTFFVGIGINYFREKEGFSPKATQSFKETIEYSSCFSLRNDGSINKLKELKLYTDKVKEIPDPGLIIDDLQEVFYTKHENYIQPAFNNPSKNINIKRYKSKDNILKLVNFANNNKLISLPHTPKDFNYFKSFAFEQKLAKKYLKFENTKSTCLEFYPKMKSIIALRGHGQLISIGYNIPGIYLSTQDKVRDFSLLNGFIDYNIDINENNWYKKLNEKFNMITKDSSYIEEWHKIRDKNIPKWKHQFKSFILKCKKYL